MWLARALACICLLGARTLSGAATPEQAQPPATFWHVGLVVEDFDTMEAFYTQVVGLKRATLLHIEDDAGPKKWPDAMRVESLDEILALQGTLVEVRHYEEPAHPMVLELLKYHSHPASRVERHTNRPLGLNHVGFVVQSLDRVLDAQRRAGLGRVLAGPVVLEDFAGRLAFLQDPEGNLVEFKEPIAAAPAAGGGKPSAEVQAQMAGQGAGGAAHPGARVFAQACESCHNGRVERAPHISFLQMMAPDQVLATLEHGVMRQQASHLTHEERQQVVEFLTGGQPQAPRVPVKRCTPGQTPFDWNDPPVQQGWGMDRRNSRFIPSEVARLSASDAPRLSLKSAFAFPGATRARSQPSFAGGAVYVGSQDGTVYALESDSGCVRWTFRAGTEVRTGVTITAWQPGDKPAGGAIGYFADLVARVYAVDLETGALKWVRKVDDHPNATATAQPVLHDGVLYAPVSSLEVVPAADPTYPCCTFRGSIVALRADTGDVKWKSYTIPTAPRAVGRNAKGTDILAPSGAPVWNSPTVDEERGLLYAGTGENYSSPAEGSSDAIIAFRLSDGAIQWIFQATQGDAWNLACMPFIPDQSNCPKERGPDVDFASPPALVQSGGRDILVAGQKSGDVWGLDPDSGKLLWHQRVGRGGNQGGQHFGLAVEGRRVFVPMSDYDDGMLPVSAARPGLYALDAYTGERLWSTPANDVCAGRKDCDPGISQAITAIPGAVFAGHMDGRLRAYDSATGRVVWETDTDREFETVSGEKGHGGSFGGGAGPMVVDGRLYAMSGYGLYFHMPGNVLLVFAPPGR
jgi:polyvinyl alcohol dehydrogenase (cytochrome)